MTQGELKGVLLVIIVTNLLEGLISIVELIGEKADATLSVIKTIIVKPLYSVTSLESRSSPSLPLVCFGNCRSWRRCLSEMPP